MFVIAWNREKAQGKGMSVWRSSLVPACVNEEVSLGANWGRAPVLRGISQISIEKGTRSEGIRRKSPED